MSFNTDFIKKNIREGIGVKELVLQDDALIERVFLAAELIRKAFISGNKLLLCGNGGSTCDAMHIAEELTGRYELDRPPFPAIPLTDASHITCVSNDYGFVDIFARAVWALGKKNDVLLALSTSGNSQNIIRAVKQAKELGMQVIAFTGETGGKLFDKSDVLINIPSLKTSRIQEAHILIGHIMIEMIEQNYGY